MDLYLELRKNLEKLDMEIAKVSETGKAYSKAYTDYRIALAQELIKLRDEGMPVTIAYDIARGKREIAHLKFEEICSEALHKANLESINATKLHIKILHTAIDKEYGHEEVVS